MWPDQDLNITLDAAVGRIKDALRQDGPSRRILLKLVEVHPNNAPSAMLFGTVHIGFSTPRLTQKRIRGDSFTLVSEEISESDLLRSLQSLSADTFAIGGFAFKPEAAPARNLYGEGLHPSGVIDDWPALLFRAELRQRLDVPRGAIVLENSSVFEDIYEAAHYWLGWSEFHGSSDARKNTLVITVSNSMFRFTSVTNTAGAVQLKFDSGSASRARVLATATVDSRPLPLQVRTLKRSAQFELPRNVESVRVVAVDKHGAILDYIDETPYYCRGIGTVLGGAAGSRSREIEDLLKMGEGPSVEYKPAIQPKHEKWGEVERTAVAFSNGGGGTILFGVDKFGKVVGIETDVRKFYKKQPDSAVNLFALDVRRNISEAASDHVTLDLDTVEHSGRIVLIAHVGEGKNKPYFTSKDNSVWIRRGATTTRADPKAELPGLMPPRSLP